MKKLISLLMAGALLGAVAIGCSKPEDQGDPNAAPATTGDSKMGETAGGVTPPSATTTGQ